MKKALVVLLALTCLSAIAFAEDAVWTWGAQLKTGAQIMLGDATSMPNATIGLYNADTPNITRIRLNGAVAMGDFALNFRVGNSGIPGAITGSTITNAAAAFELWWATAKFMDSMIQVRAGDIDNAVSGTVNNGYIGLSVIGMQFVVVPMSGLSIGLAMPLTSPAVKLDGDGIRVGLAYTMTDLVTVRATYVNQTLAKTSDAEFGVALLMIPNLTAEFEANIQNLGGIVTTTDYIELFQNAAYKMDALTVGLTADETLWGDTAQKMTIWVKPNVDYMVMEGTNVGASVKYTMNVAGGTTSGLVVDPYVKFTLNSAAAIKIDAAYTLLDLATTGTWTLPININFLWSY